MVYTVVGVQNFEPLRIIILNPYDFEPILVVFLTPVSGAMTGKGLCAKATSARPCAY
jgi:hypothetical protein